MLDPIPTSTTHECLDVPVSLIMVIVNASLSAGTVPPQLMRARDCPCSSPGFLWSVTLLLKMPGLKGPEDLQTHVRSVFYLKHSWEGRLDSVEKATVCEQSYWNLSVCLQAMPQYRDCVLSVLDGLLVSKDEKLVSLVALLDLSATFDTLDHLILLKRLETTHHMWGSVFDWLVSFLSNHLAASCLLLHDRPHTLTEPVKRRHEGGREIEKEGFWEYWLFTNCNASE